MSHEQSHRTREQDLLVSRGIWLIEEGEPTRRATDTIQAPKESQHSFWQFSMSNYMYFISESLLFSSGDLNLGQS